MTDRSTADDAVDTLPLAGVRVLDTAMLYAAPLIATFLADLGAEVFKIEPPTGDQYRPWGPMWALVGRRKRSITLDLTQPDGRALLLQMVPSFDVVIENLPRAVAERRGLTPEHLRVLNPSLVVVSASGFGPDGPYADRAANGTVAEAFSGLTGLTGDADGPPQLPSAPLGDAVAAAFGAMGALAGVIRALKTGRGATVDLTVHEPLLHALGSTLSSYRPGDEPPHRDGGAMNVALRGTFGTVDGGWIAISASTPRHVETVGELAGGDPGTPIRERAAAWIASSRRDEVMAALSAARVSATAVNDLAEMAADPHIAHRSSLGSLNGHTVVRPTPAIDGPPNPAWTSELGEANAEVFGGWLGLESGAIADLRQRGVI